MTAPAMTPQREDEDSTMTSGVNGAATTGDRRTVVAARKKAEWKNYRENVHPADCVLAEKSDYDGGDPSLELVMRSDGLFDLVIYKFANDLTVHALSEGAIQESALRILDLLPLAPRVGSPVAKSQSNEEVMVHRALPPQPTGDAEGLVARANNFADTLVRGHPNVHGFSDFRVNAAKCLREMANAVRSADSRLAEAVKRIEGYQARLEIDHVIEHRGGEKVRVDIPPDQRDKYPDGIECRDDTIKTLDKNVETLRARVAELEKALADARLFLSNEAALSTGARKEKPNALMPPGGGTPGIWSDGSRE